jgi:hypothetical protein
MKTVINFCSLALLLICLTGALHAQTTSIWQGGIPGQTTDWNTAANWKENRVPDEYSLVIIPSDRQFYPVLEEEVEPIDALLLEGGAALTLGHDGYLAILGETGRMEGIILYGTIQNKGTLELRFDHGNTAGAMGQIKGNGVVYGSDQEQMASLRTIE